jgi:AcrR family transcriptional regulator
MLQATNQAVDRRAAILQAAAEVLAREGIAETNLRRIAQQAGMSSGTLHYYFPSKDELLDALILKAVTPLYEKSCEILHSEGHPRDVLAELVEQTFELFDSDWDTYHVALQLGDHLRARKPAEFPSAITLLEEWVGRGQRAGLVRQGDALLLAMLCQGIILRVQRARVFGELKPPLSRFATEVIDACWRVLATEPTPSSRKEQP